MKPYMKHKPNSQNIAVFAIGTLVLNGLLVNLMDNYPRNLNPSVTEFIGGTIAMSAAVGALNFAWALLALRIKLKR